MSAIEKNMKRIVGLDLVRFLAALGIISYHYFFIGVIQGFYANEVFYPIAFWGEFGVDIFFILSGFFILFSIKGRKTSLLFLKGRILRIYPAFIICSVLTMAMGMIMPGTSKSDLVFRWVNSLTLCNDLWGVQPLSSIYWTLMVEMKFYILVAIIIKLGIWQKHKHQILFIWVCLSLFNTLSLNWSWLEMLFNAKYAGHFTIGIIFYLIYEGQSDKLMIPTFAGSTWLVYRNCISYAEWIRGIYKGGGVEYSDIDILFAVIVMISLVFFASYVTVGNGALSSIISFLGAWSYTIYLVHADFGYFIRTQYYSRLILWVPWLADVVNEYMIMLVAVLASLLLAYIVLLFEQWIMKNIKIK